MVNNNKNNKNKRNNSFNMSKISNNFKILLCLILVIILVLIVNKKYNNHSHYVEKFNNTELYNQFKKSNYIIEPTQDDDKGPIHYLYWTGGYDSTFRLCEMLIDEGKRVQPIYVALVLDNDCVTEETCDKLWLRRNRKEEKKAMTKIFNKLKERYPKVKKLLLPLKEINQPITDNQFNLEFEKLFYSNNLWPKKRKKHQYLFLAKYAFYHKKHIDIGVLGIHHKSKFAKFLKKNLVKIYNGPHLNYEIIDKSHPISYLNFPLYGRSKEDLLEKAKKHNYHDILTLTWSCWFPKNGKPCQVCPMCKERIVTHPIEN